MATTAVSSYPQLVKRAGVALGEVTKVGDLEFINETVPATSMESGGWKEKISGQLKEVSDLVIVMNYVALGLDLLMADWAAGTASSYTVTYKNTEVGTFTAICSKVKVLGSEADKPDAPQQAEITFEVTGASTLT
jgi:hypothetical protein